jgi:hypothetical protein
MNTLVETIPPAAPQQHHKYGGSKLNALAACPGYQNRDETNAAAEDGTRLHGIMERVMRRVTARLAQAKPTTALNELIDLLESGDVFVDENEKPLLVICCEELDSWLKEKPEKILLEALVHLSHPNGEELNHGHIDVLMLWPKRGVLVDYKFGWIPVPPATQNLQGIGYTAAAFQEFGALDQIDAVFIQPKLVCRTEKRYVREQLYWLFQQVLKVIEAAENPGKTLHPNPYCDFCAVAGTCPAIAKIAQTAVMKYEGINLPDVFRGADITTSEQAIIALYAQQRMEALFEKAEISKRVLEFAQANGGRLELKVSDSETLVVTLGRRKMARRVHSPNLVAEALTQELGEECAANVVLGASKIAVTDLEDRFADVLVEKRLRESATMKPNQAKEHRVTKKEAREILGSILRSEGLMSVADGLLTFPKLRLEKTLIAEASPATEETQTKTED